MKLVLCGDPELDHDDRLRALSHALRASGHEVLDFFAGSIERTDLHPEHWHKSLDPDVAARLRALIDAETPELVLVCHWRRLSRDLITVAARAGVRGVLFPVGEGGTCLLSERVRPDTGARCEAPLAAMQCIRCAEAGAVRADWVPFEQQFLSFAETERDLKRELDLAQLVIFPDAAARAHLEQAFPHYAEVEASETLSSGDDWPALIQILERVAAEQVTLDDAGDRPAEQDWYQERMQRFARDEWDRKCEERERGEG